MKTSFFLLVLASTIPLVTATTPANNSTNDLIRCNPTYNQADANYLHSMIEHHEKAVKMAELVPDHTNREELLNLSDQVINAQNTEIKRMEEFLEESCVSPDINESQHIAPSQRQMDYLDSLNGTGFDLTFINMMSSHHADALMESRLIVEEGQSEKIRYLAQDIIEAQQQEIFKMYGWYIEWH